MTLGIDQVDRHGRANTNHTDRAPLRQMIRADRGNETVNSQPPRLEISNGDSPAAPLRYHKLRRRGPRPPRCEHNTSIRACAGDARHENAVERSPEPITRRA